MKSNIFIPKTINVGFQNRSDTYTGKLGYVIYYDEKGKLRKEASWNSWRDENIPNEEFENVPMSGFVLNRRAGGVEESWGWNTRKTYCRVYDPRNFEFEITIENLLFILQNCSMIKGKGIEGELVYGWDGKDLVLLPVESPDYKEISEYNSIVHNNESIKAKDLIVGATYLDKDNNEYVYMGKFDYYSYGYQWESSGKKYTSKKYSDIPTTNGKYGLQKISYEYIDYLYGKYFWFATKVYDYEYLGFGKRQMKDTYHWAFIQLKSISKKFITCSNELCIDSYSDIYEEMIRTSCFSPRDYENIKRIPYTFEEFKKYAEMLDSRYGNERYKYNRFITENGVLYELIRNNNTKLWTVEQYTYTYFDDQKTIRTNKEDFYNRFYFQEVKTKGRYYWEEDKIIKKIIPMDLKELYEKLKPSYEEIYLKNGYLYERKFYYGDEE